jgi:hypothetical protein
MATKLQLGDAEVIITLPGKFALTLKRQIQDGEAVITNETDSKLIELHLPACLGSRHVRSTIRPATIPARRRDPVLIKALRTAYAMVEVTCGGTPLIETMPRPRYQRRLLRLAFLSPDIQRAILAGRQPAGLRLEDLIRNPIPTDWTEQQRWIERLAG